MRQLAGRYAGTEGAAGQAGRAAALLPARVQAPGMRDLAGENGGRVPWCGPAAVALVTGCSLDTASAMLREIAPHWYPEDGPVVTAYWRDLLGALDRAGVPYAPFAPGQAGRTSLLRMLRRGGPEGAMLEPGWYLLRVTGHFLLLRSYGFGLGTVHDNRHSGVLVTHRAHGLRRVTHAARVLGGPCLD